MIYNKNSWDFVGQEQILVGQCPMTDCYMQSCLCEEQHSESKVSCNITTLQPWLKPGMPNAESGVHLHVHVTIKVACLSAPNFSDLFWVIY